MKKRLINMEDINRKNNGYVGADDSTVYAESVESKRSNRFMCVRPIPKRNAQKGITLVALVITIIILLILAMVSIKIVLDGGLITKASKATDTHTIAAEKETIGLAYNTYQIAKIQDKDYTMQKALDEQKANATVTPKGDDWNVKFTKTNNEYELKKDGTITLTKQGDGSTEIVGWTDNGDDTFTKGEVTVKVGDIVNYDEGTGYSTTVTANDSGYSSDQTYTTENLGWRVLGISAKGELELISDNPTSSTLYLEGDTGYLNAEEVLNNMCNELYGQGEHATGARSLNVEDINKLASYDPTTYGGYGDIWTYRFPTSGDYMQYRRTKADGTLVTDWTVITISGYQTFRVPGETEKISSDNRNDTGRSLENTSYVYTVADKVKQTTSDGKNMSDIISKGTGSSATAQWLASRIVGCMFERANFCVRYVYNFVSDYYMYSSNGDSHSHSYRVRPVVTLESDIQLTGNSNDGWTIE